MENIQITIVIAVFAAFIAMLIAGATNRIVVYFDKTDLVISFMPWGTILAAYILLLVYEHNETLDFAALSGVQTFIWYTGLALAALFALWCIRLSVIHNHSLVLGVLVGIFKLLASVLAALFLVGQFLKIQDKKAGVKDAIAATLTIGVTVWLINKLVNGERVYLAKGWALPAAQPASEKNN